MKIGIVGGSSIAQEAQRALAQRPAHEVLWIALDAAEALALCARRRPELVLLDVNMARLDSSGTVRRIMAEFPCAILIVTLNVSASAARVFEAMGEGAIDAVDAPGSHPSGTAAFLKKIDTLDMLVGARHLGTGTDNTADTGIIRRRDRLVCIGASAGGPAALATILGGIPKDFQAAIVIVQHVDEHFARGMAEWLGQHSQIPVRAATANERPAPGVALLAATNLHLQLNSRERLHYCSEPIEAIHRPSIDVFFTSACSHWCGDLVGVLLTGMGRDGARGLQVLRDHGHYTIAQDRATSAVYGMPKAAVALGAAIDVLPLEKIAPRLIDAMKYGVSDRSKRPHA